MKEFYNKHAGERVFLCGNGPSLKQTSLNKLRNEYSMGINKINQIYAGTKWRPTYHTVFNKNLTLGREKAINESLKEGATCFVYSEHKDVFGHVDGIHYVNKTNLLSNSVNKSPLHKLSTTDIEEMNVDDLEKYWSHNVDDVVYSYHSMYAALQILFYMGFDKIYLLGCDLGFGKHDPHMVFNTDIDPMDYGSNSDFFQSERKYIFDSLNKGVLIRSIVNGVIYKILSSRLRHPVYKSLKKLYGANDSNHFSEQYRTRPGDLSYLNEEIPKSHMVAKKIAEKEGISILDATIGGELEVYPKINGLEGVIE